jgi:hypothetical protein
VAVRCARSTSRSVSVDSRRKTNQQNSPKRSNKKRYGHHLELREGSYGNENNKIWGRGITVLDIEWVA